LPPSSEDGSLLEHGKKNYCFSSVSSFSRGRQPCMYIFLRIYLVRHFFRVGWACSVFLLNSIPWAASWAAEAKEIQSAPFGPRSGPPGKTMFTTLATEHTGIQAFNAYDDPRMWWELYREFSLGAIGSGVSICDYDADGWPDVYVVSKTGPNRLFRNLGDFRFEDSTERAGVAGPVGSWKQGAAFADVDNDGRQDLYVCRFGAPNLLYINQGDGTFREEAAARGLALSDASSMAAFCDYDRDGWLDVFVQTNLLDGERRPNGQRDHLYRNTGDGTFTDVTDRAGIVGDTQGHSATWWDFDEDGWPDLYVANDFKDPDQFYRNNGNGTFTNVLSWVVPHTPHSSMGADLGDVNNDGRLDLLVADMAATSRHKDHRGMAKLRDGLTENEQRPEAAPQYMRNALFLNLGAGVLLEGAFLAGLDATDWTWSVRLEDLDNDGWVDAHFTNGMVRELHGSDLLKQMLSKESMGDRIRIARASPPLAERHLAFRNRGDLNFEEVSAAWGLDQTGIGLGAAFGDLDGDGDLDLIYSSLDGELTVCRNDTAAGQSVEIALRGTTSNRFGVGAVVRIQTNAGQQVRALTLARGYLSTSEPTLHFGLGEQSTIKQLTIEWPSGRRQTFTDLAAGKRYTINEPDAAAPTEPSLKLTPQFSDITQSTNLNVQNREGSLNELKIQPLLPWRLNRVGPSVAVGRFDADAEDDIALGGVAGEPGQLFSNLGGGQFLAYGSSVFSDAATLADGPIATIDADADGDLDLLITKAGVSAPPDTPGYTPRLMLNDGSGRFTPAAVGVMPSIPISVGAVAVADFDRTGRAGVFIGGRVIPGSYPQPARSVLLSSRDGKLVDVTAEFAPTLAQRGMVAAALWSDVDGDGWIDLLVAYDWGEVACYRNIDGKRFEDASEGLGFSAAGSGWWRSLAAGDFNGDGRLDYAAGNVGLNTRYRASSAEPAVLYAGVSLDGSPPQMIEAQAEEGKWYPLRTREVLSRVFPSLTRRFPTAESYARATIQEVFPGTALENATKFSATELRSGVFLSQQDGTFRFTPLPRLAQLAPIYGMAAGDFDGDGRIDLIALGNSFAPIPEVSRFDGGVGWFLRGDGRGNLNPVSPEESGVVVRRDAKALAVIDFNQDGWPDLLATRNNDRPLALLNHGAGDRRSFGVALRGGPGNPHAIGARLTLTLRDGSTQTAEVAGGSGYFAQSTKTVFFGYAEDVLPRELKIRWPDGRETVQTFEAAPSKTLRISAP
jgi:hypothetical protein